MRKAWRVKQPDSTLQKKLKDELGISSVLAQLLINRNLTTAQAAQDFLDPRLSSFHDSSLLPDIEKAKDRIFKASRNKEKILLFSDYDADGITALAILKIALGRLGIAHEHYIPHRLREGYSLSEQSVRYAREKGFGLIITLDCGITNFKEIEDLKKLHIDVLVIDHHSLLASGKLPIAYAVINPKRRDSRYPYADLAGVGLAYKFAGYLLESLMEEELDLACLGTVADVVPLSGENRVIVKEGLGKLNSTQRLGLKSLFETSGIKNKTITAEHVSYILAPRINACGRLGSSEAALKLLLCACPKEAKTLSHELHSQNRERQRIESQILDEALNKVETEIDLAKERVIVLHNDNWHQGVLGIVAARITDRFHRPAFVVSFSDEVGKGSGRSIESFPLFENLLECSPYLLGFGGHKRACGLSILRKEIGNFRQNINRLAFERLGPEDLLPSVNIDLELQLGEVTMDLLQEINQLEPFGQGNPRPVFASSNLHLKSKPVIMGKDTLKFWVSDGKATYPAIGFKMARYFDLVNCAAAVNLAYRISLDTWNGNNQLQLEIEDIRLPG